MGVILEPASSITADDLSLDANPEFLLEIATLNPETNWCLRRGVLSLINRHPFHFASLRELIFSNLVRIV